MVNNTELKPLSATLIKNCVLLDENLIFLDEDNKKKLNIYI